MYEPSAVPPPKLPPRPVSPTVEAGLPGLTLLHEVREAQRRALWVQGLFLACASLAAGLVLGGYVGAAHPVAGQAIAVAGPLLGLAALLSFGAWLPRRRVGDSARTARLLAEKIPGLNLDLLAAVELSKALGKPDDFSPELARAFLRSVDARAARHPVHTLIDPRPVRRAAATLAFTLLAAVLALGMAGARIRGGLLLAFSARTDAEASRREPITGDFELTYHYPAHTGLESRTVPGSTGDLSAPAGTEVLIKTRADRDVSAAALIVNGARVPMLVDGRNLSARFVLETSGQYHVAFLSGERVKAEGPDLSITVEADQVPQVRITSPAAELELDPSKQQVTVKFEASDDYGIAALDLVFKPSGGEQHRVPLKPDEGRTTRGQYQWELLPLKLKPGQSVSYYLEATDNDAVKGPKKGVSATLKLKLYSADEHRREALKKAEALWERLILHLADRLEGPDRSSPTTREAAIAGLPVDERAGQLSQDFTMLTGELLHERQPPEELVDALVNIGKELRADTALITAQRRVLVREGRPNQGDNAPPPSLARRLPLSLATDAAHSEKNVLYLEALLDRQKLAAIKALARELKDDRRELSKLLEDYDKTKDPATQQALLEQMDQLKQQMLELEQRMSELAKGIRDDFMNADSMQEMMKEQNLGASLEEVEKLIREGKTEEAMKKMQELSMKMDQFLENLDQAADSADQQMDPELARKFSDFQDNLEQTVQQQEALSEKTRALRDKYRAQQKERISRQGEALKRELQQRLDELDRSWKQINGERYGGRFQDTRNQAQRDLDNVKQSLAADDFDLASESADRLEQRAELMSSEADEQRRLDEMFQNPPEVRRDSKQLRDKLQGDAKKAEAVAKKLRDLFPQPGQQMSEGDRQAMAEQSRQQQALQQRAQQLQQQMAEIGQRAPIFNEEAQQQVEQAGEKMQNASQRLQSRDASRGFGEQQGAVQSLKGLQQAMQQQGKGGKGGIPLPLKGGGQGRGLREEKIEIPDEDPNQAPREFRKDVLELMKQGAPDRYRDQNKKYYEELVK